MHKAHGETRLASTASSFLLGRAHALSLMVAKHHCLGREPLSLNTPGLQKPLLKATSQALEVPRFFGIASAKDTGVEKWLQKQQHAAKRGRATGMGFALHRLWEFQHLFCSSLGWEPQKPNKLGAKHPPCWEPLPQISLWSCLYI